VYVCLELAGSLSQSPLRISPSSFLHKCCVMFIAILISFGHFSAVHARVTSEVPLTMLPHLLPEVLFPSFPPSFYFSLSLWPSRSLDYTCV